MFFSDPTAAFAGHDRSAKTASAARGTPTTACPTPCPNHSDMRFASRSGQAEHDDDRQCDCHPHRRQVLLEQALVHGRFLLLPSPERRNDANPARRPQRVHSSREGKRRVPEDASPNSAVALAPTAGSRSTERRHVWRRRTTSGRAPPLHVAQLRVRSVGRSQLLRVETVTARTVPVKGPTPFFERIVRTQYPNVDLNLGAAPVRCSSPMRIRSTRPSFQFPGPYSISGLGCRMSSRGHRAFEGRRTTAHDRVPRW